MGTNSIQIIQLIHNINIKIQKQYQQKAHNKY